MVISLAALLATNQRQCYHQQEKLPASRLGLGLPGDLLSRTLRWPLLIASIGTMDYAVFVWSIRFVDTAVATVINELWPVFLVFFLITCRKRSHAQNSAVTTSLSKQLALSCVAAVGLVLMVACQSENSLWNFLGSISSTSVKGMLLALFSAVLVGSSICGTLVYGDKLFEHHYGKIAPTDTRSRYDRIALLRFALVAHAISTGIGSILSLSLGVIFSNEIHNIGGPVTAQAVLGSICLGVVGSAASILLRYGNIASQQPGLNAIFFLSPGLALIWLALIGITIPRMDFFVIGAALILSINVLLNASHLRTSPS